MNLITKTLSIAAIATPCVMAAESFSIGAHASVAYSAFWNETDTKDFWGPGFNVGAAAYIPFNPIIGLNPELTFAYRYASDEETETDEYDGKIKEEVSFSQINIDVPILFRINLMQTGVFFEAGPLLSFDLDADSKDKMTYGGESETDKHDLDQNLFEFGLIAGAGYSITNRIDVDFRFALGLTKLYDEEGAKTKSFMFHLGGTFWIL